MVSEHEELQTELLHCIRYCARSDLSVAAAFQESTKLMARNVEKEV
jgi:hypothetical protein